MPGTPGNPPSAKRGAVQRARRILLACLPSCPDLSRLKQEIEREPIDWAALYQLAHLHKMAGIIAPVLLKILNGDLPDSSEAPWRRSWHALAFKDMIQLKGLEEILLGSQARGIRPMLLKGFSIHHQAYPNDTARGAFDLDLLVRPTQIAPMIQFLQEEGFTLTNTDPKERQISDWRVLLRRTSEAVLSRPSDGVDVDLHWALCAPIEERAAGLRLLSRIWIQTRQIRLGRALCAIPGKEEELLFVGLHLLKGWGFFLRGLCDLIRLLEASPSVNWDRLLSLACQTGTAAILYHAFELVNQASPDLVPQSVQTRLSRSSRIRWLLSPSLKLDRLVESQGGEPTNLAIRWKGVLFSGRPWVWIPYEVGLNGKWLLRQVRSVLR